MAFFDNLRSQNSGGSNSYTVVLRDIPTTLEQLKAMPEGALSQPQHTAALTIAALCLYPSDKAAAIQMLTYLHGPRGLSVYDQQFLADRFRDKDYVPRSYFTGAVPQNNYTPAAPYSLTFFENPYSRNQLADGYLTLHIRSGGADSPRQIKLRRKPSTGQWFLVEQFLLSDIQPCADSDPWK